MNFYLGGLLGPNKVSAALYTLVPHNEAVLQGAQLVDEVPCAVVLQQSLPVLSHLTTDAAAVVPSSTFIEIEIKQKQDLFEKQPPPPQEPEPSLQAAASSPATALGVGVANMGC